MEGENYAVRISLGQDEVHSIMSRWAPHAKQIVAYEHEDGNRTHCHMLVMGCKVGTARLKQLEQRQERGNAFHNYKTVTDTNGDMMKYITYMSKGKYDPFYNSTEYLFTWKELEKLKDKWTAPAAPVTKKTTLDLYNEFEAQIRARPVNERSDRTWIRLHARTFLFAHHKMMNQQYRNNMRDFEDTYAFKFHLTV